MTALHMFYVLTGIIVLMGLLYVTLAAMSVVVYLKKLPTPHGLKFILRICIALCQLTVVSVFWYAYSLGMLRQEWLLPWLFMLMALYAGCDLWAAYRDYRNRHETHAYGT
ncbi:MAG: hypothetical protein EON60_12390 [Alphaproteobacteria bacterium]|nr:MAG: hypothetical protein EON60_12390 [Alphaproteobacteria bacterium]